jgi:hypothetical protein
LPDKVEKSVPSSSLTEKNISAFEFPSLVNDAKNKPALLLDFPEITGRVAPGEPLPMFIDPEG